MYLGVVAACQLLSVATFIGYDSSESGANIGGGILAFMPSLPWSLFVIAVAPDDGFALGVGHLVMMVAAVPNALLLHVVGNRTAERSRS